MSKFAGRGYIRAAGIPVTDVTQLSLRMVDGNSDVDLLLGGGGFAQGNHKFVLEAQGAMGINGWQIDWIAVCAAGEELALDFVILGDGTDPIFERPLVGDVRSPKIDSKNNAAVTYGFEFHGRDPVQ